VDTNTNPSMIDFPIPSNDDAARTIRLFTDAIADAVIEAKAEYQSKMVKETKSSASNKSKSSKKGKSKEEKVEADATVETAAVAQ
ncbi:MAG: 30S ribosomal protein S2, partial [Bdellovibrionales bacterium]|nr:30S ribosomal protein S2 [Bdellovibrionales bacterium]